MTALPEPVVALGDLPGARYVLVVDASGERVRGELGGPPESDLAVLAWARRLADISRERGRAMEDVVLTTGSAFHLVRCVPGVGEDVWVALRIDRERGNLALARRALAALDGTRSGGARPRALTTSSAPVPTTGPATGPVPVPRPGTGGPTTGSFPAAMPLSGGPVPLAPAPRRAPDPELPRPTSRSGVDVPALAFLPPARQARPTRPAPVAPEEVPPPAALVHGMSAAADRPLPAAKESVPRVDGASDASGAINGSFPSEVEPSEVDQAEVEPTGVEPSEESVRCVDGASDASGATDGSFPTEVEPAEVEPTERDPQPDPAAPGLWDPRRRPLTVRQAHTWRTAPEVPAAPGAREPVEHVTPAPVVPAPRTGSLFAPVVVVPPPPSPVDDDTTEVPAPVPYPIITAPPLEPVVVAAEPVVVAPEPVVVIPDPDPTPEEPAATDAGLPRRVPGAHLRSPTPAVDPAPAAALATGLPGWSTEASVLRRLITGLRRLT